MANLISVFMSRVEANDSDPLRFHYAGFGLYLIILVETLKISSILSISSDVSDLVGFQLNLPCLIEFCLLLL